MKTTIGWRVAQLSMMTASPVALAMVAAPANAQSQVKQFDIPAQSLSSAILEFSRQSDVLIVVSPELTAGKRSRPLKGAMPVNEAIGQLLRGSSLRAVPNPSGGYRIDRARGASVASAAQRTQSSGEGNDADSGEIVVTAQKKQERLQDVPVPISVVAAVELANRGQSKIQDYAAQIPGLSVVNSHTEVSGPILTIRGLSSGGFSNPTVGVVVDEVSYGSSTTNGGVSAPDIDPSDLARIEVLRGPQGTLYGASSIGGLIKFVTVDPSVNRFSASLNLGLSSTTGASNPSYNVRGSANVPLSSAFAVRVSGFSRKDAGYIDDPLHARENVNDEKAYGGRVSALWSPSEDLKVRASALYQKIERGGSFEISNKPGLTGLEQDFLPGTGKQSIEVQAYSLTADAKIDNASLVSATGYSINDFQGVMDVTGAYGGITSSVFGVTGTPDYVQYRTKKFTQELRVSLPIGSTFDWLIGAFYTHEDAPIYQDIQAANVTGNIVGSGLRAYVKSTFEEYAVFTNLNVHLTEQLHLQVGGRQSHNRQKYQSIFYGPLVPIFFGSPPPLINPLGTSSENAFTYLVTPEYHITKNIMVYARFASGYRPGGPNPNGAANGVQTQYSADRTENYEVGIKGTLARGLSIDASVYRIDWKDIQVQVRDPITTAFYLTNGATARSQGAELSVAWSPLSTTKLSGWVSYNDAKLTEDFGPTNPSVGRKGDRLPRGSKWSGNISVDQDFEIGSDATAFVGATLNFVGDRVGNFRAVAQRELFPGYIEIGLRGGVRYGPWEVEVYANNLTDKRGVVSGGLDAFDPTSFVLIRPRTIGATVSRSF